MCEAQTTQSVIKCISNALNPSIMCEAQTSQSVIKCISNALHPSIMCEAQTSQSVIKCISNALNPSIIHVWGSKWVWSRAGWSGGHVDHTGIQHVRNTFKLLSSFCVDHASNQRVWNPFIIIILRRSYRDSAEIHLLSSLLPVLQWGLFAVSTEPCCRIWWQCCCRQMLHSALALNRCWGYLHCSDKWRSPTSAVSVTDWSVADKELCPGRWHHLVGPAGNRCSVLFKLQITSLTVMHVMLH